MKKMLMFGLVILACNAFAGASFWQDIFPHVPPVVTNIIPVPTPQPEEGKLLPKPATLVQPEYGPECPNYWGGKDIRCLAWGNRKSGGKDWVFVACKEWKDSLTVNGKDVSAKNYFERGSVKYITAGHKEPSSSGPLQENLAGTYKTTMRWYYWPTKSGVSARLFGAVRCVFGHTKAETFADGYVCGKCDQFIPGPNYREYDVEADQ